VDEICHGPRAAVAGSTLRASLPPCDLKYGGRSFRSGRGRPGWIKGGSYRLEEKRKAGLLTGSERHVAEAALTVEEPS
jgi:hypothetical protein